MWSLNEYSLPDIFDLNIGISCVVILPTAAVFASSIIFLYELNVAKPVPESFLKWLNLTANVCVLVIASEDPGLFFNLARLYFDPSCPLSKIKSLDLSTNVPFAIAFTTAFELTPIEPGATYTLNNPNPSATPKFHGPVVLFPVELLLVWITTSVFAIDLTIPGALVSLTLWINSKLKFELTALPKLIVNVWPAAGVATWDTAALAADLFFNDITLPCGYAILTKAAFVFAIFDIGWSILNVESVTISVTW